MSLGLSTTTPDLLPGTPCWVDLATPDEAIAQRFYSGLFGWRYEERPDPATGRYTLADIDGVPTGGIYQAGAGQAPGWTLHLSVSNTAAAADWVERLGGRTTLGPVSIPDRGSIAHAVDPSGVPVVLWQVASSWNFGYGAPGMFAGADLNTHDGTASDAFFCRLFSYSSMQIGAEGLDYAEWRLDQQPVLYRYVMGTEYRATSQPHWMVYFEVDPAVGTDVMAEQAGRLGGRVVAPPFDTPFGRTAVLADPGGGTFSVIDHSNPIEGWGRAEVDDPYGD